mmetsp:Transcript_40312/g.104265  ORF Transcript_40312/g.104265 Transcript_40312/m.104265 type:complete len:138 (+) Transcript_40312:3-416(+)
MPLEDFVEAEGRLTFAPLEFIVVISKPGIEAPLGVDVDISDCQRMVIDRIHPAGVVPRWNKEHPTQQLRVGDAVVEVNGAKGSADWMTQVCAADLVLELRVQRPMNLHRGPPCMGASWCTVSCLSKEEGLPTLGQVV